MLLFLLVVLCSYSGFLHVAHGDCYPCMLLGFVMLLVAAVVLAFFLVVASFCFVSAAVALNWFS